MRPHQAHKYQAGSPDCTPHTIIIRVTRTAMNSCAVTCTTVVTDTNTIHDIYTGARYEALVWKEEDVPFRNSKSKMKLIITCALAVTTSDQALKASTALHAHSWSAVRKRTTAR